MGSYLFKAGDEDLARWRAAAKLAGVSFAEWLRAAAAAHVGGERAGGPSASRSLTPPVKRKGSCPRENFHRPGTFCKECDGVPRS